MLPGQRGAVKSSSCALTASVQPATVSKPELGIPDSEEFLSCQNTERLR